MDKTEALKAATEIRDDMVIRRQQILDFEPAHIPAYCLFFRQEYIGVKFVDGKPQIADIDTMSIWPGHTMPVKTTPMNGNNHKAEWMTFGEAKAIRLSGIDEALALLNSQIKMLSK